MIFAVLDPSPLTVCINCSFFTFISSSFRKIFNVRSNEIVDFCRYMFNCSNIEDILSMRKKNFLQKYCSLENIVCVLCRNQADVELASLDT